MGVREAKVEKHLHDEITAIGGMERKWTNPNYSVPDRIVVYKGVIWLVETKTRDGVLSGAQEREQERWIKCGANVITLNSRTEVDQFIIALQMSL